MREGSEGMPAGVRAVRPRERMNSPRENRKVRLRERMNSPGEDRAVRLRERMNSPLERRKVGLCERMNSPLGRRKVRLREQMNSPLGRRKVRLRERMNSPLGRRKVRLRGLGGPAAWGVPRACASATGAIRRHRSIGNAQSVIPRERRAALARATNRGATEESTLGLLVIGRSTRPPAATVPAGGLRVRSAANSFARGGGLRVIRGDLAALTHSRTHALTHFRAGVAS